MTTTAIDTAAIADQLKRTALKVLRLDLPLEAITADTNLYELGLESLNVVELLTEVEATFGILVDVDDLSAELFGRFDNFLQFVVQKIDATH